MVLTMIFHNICLDKKRFTHIVAMIYVYSESADAVVCIEGGTFVDKPSLKCALGKTH